MRKTATVQSYLERFDLQKIIPEQLKLSAKLINLQRHEALILQESSPIGIFLLVDGSLQVEHYDIDGGNVVLTIQESLSVLGDLEFFCSDCKNKTLSSVKATKPSRVIFFPSSALISIGFNDLSFLRFICQHLAKKVFYTSFNNLLAPLNATKKLQRYLYMQSVINGNNFKLIKRDDLASLLGISVRQLSRAITYLISAGFISIHIKTVTIHRSLDIGES